METSLLALIYSLWLLTPLMVSIVIHLWQADPLFKVILSYVLFVLFFYFPS